MTAPNPDDAAARRASAAFVTLADTLRPDSDVTDLMRRLTGHCVDLLEIAGAGVMIADRDGILELIASSNDTMRLLEQYEIDVNAGPCLSAFHENGVIEIHDLGNPEPQWVEFSAQARIHGYVAMHAFPLRQRDQIIGVLNLYSTTAGPLSRTDQQCGQTLADITTIATLQHRALTAYATTTAQLQAAFTTRLVIEQAKGILTERHRISNDEAFNLIRSYARYHNLKIADLSYEITTGARTLRNDWAPPSRKKTAAPENDSAFRILASAHRR